MTAQALEVAGLTYDDLDRVSHVSYTRCRLAGMRDNNAQVFTLGTTVAGFGESWIWPPRATSS